MSANGHEGVDCPHRVRFQIPEFGVTNNDAEKRCWPTAESIAIIVIRHKRAPSIHPQRLHLRPLPSFCEPTFRRCLPPSLVPPHSPVAVAHPLGKIVRQELMLLKSGVALRRVRLPHLGSVRLIAGLRQRRTIDGLACSFLVSFAVGLASTSATAED